MEQLYCSLFSFFFLSGVLEDGPEKGPEAWGCALDYTHLPPISSMFPSTSVSAGEREAENAVVSW